MNEFRCPCCGSEIVAPPTIEQLRDLPGIGRRKGEILALLAARYPRAVPSETIFDQLYQLEAENDQPLPENVKVLVSQLRKQLRGTGWTIPREQGGPGMAARYRLAPEAA